MPVLIVPRGPRSITLDSAVTAFEEKAYGGGEVITADFDTEGCSIHGSRISSALLYEVPPIS
jgi:hypothetical protein